MDTKLKVGDTDDMGFHVGYIDDEGVAWESEQEAAVSVAFGRWQDAWTQWDLWGTGDEPDPTVPALKLPPAYQPEFWSEVDRFFTFWIPMARIYQTSEGAKDGISRSEYLRRTHGRVQPPQFNGERLLCQRCGRPGRMFYGTVRCACG